MQRGADIEAARATRWTGDGADDGGVADAVVARFRAALPATIDGATLRFAREQSAQLAVRRGVAQPAQLGDSRGAMLTVAAGGGVGYAATADLSAAGLGAAVARATAWARLAGELSRGGGRSEDTGQRPGSLRLGGAGAWRGPQRRPWAEAEPERLIALLRAADGALAAGDAVVDRQASLWLTRAATTLADAEGARIDQQTDLLVPDLEAVANRGTDTVRRTLAGRGLCRQGGAELLDAIDLPAEAARIGAQALQLLDAPPCPTETCDLLLDPDQMTLQIHESIGHPLELDRILGDERNYAGTSFVTPEMFGSYRYGSELLDVTFDPSVDGEFASYGFDDAGTPAARAYLIRGGVLLRPLGSAASGARAGLDHVANARACSWNRPPIDRMANLNVEPGRESLQQLIGRTARGVLLQTNCSWSIDDSRNKFQFGCEIGWTIRDGVLGEAVRNPNYRGVSATFWRSLVGVGDVASRGVYGSPFCGKGEPNQAIRVGHASPACLFRDVEVFAGG